MALAFSDLLSDTASTQESGVPKRQFEGLRLAAQTTLHNAKKGARGTALMSEKGTYLVM
jgi:hypothetical protein